ncbi:MFS transporter [Clostridium cellulovorans]|uniref:Major facilitator superfamily (MFS) profile domain-containing protein n=1 Tax=Clostridium cellulovorans (strain ATCC 35296 / DSM 3052 / OCM 3 / 743B) TaxID=573061 RepID=D9SU68_CLOC7|nr:MFS transporter [Clostridium cellulovorans]ADL52823.1 protein of unknown function DUF894 DitE [Clostridium cellulovorans 743B]
MKTILNRDFSLIFVGNTISVLGSVIYDTAILWWVTEYTGSAKDGSLILAAAMLATIIISLFSGIIADNANKKYILVVTDILSGLVCISVAIMIKFNILNMIFLILASAILGINNALFRPTIKSFIPEVVNGEKLVKANSLLESIGAVIRIAGPVIASYLVTIKFFGIWGCMFLNGSSFIISAIFELCVNYKVKVKRKISFKKVFPDILLGFKYAFKEKNIKLAIINAAVVNFFLVSFNIMLPIFTQNILYKDSKFYSYMLSAEAIGAIIATTYLIKKEKKDIELLTIFNSIFLIGVIYTIFTIRLHIFILIAGIALVGGLSSYFNVLFISYIQKNINLEYLGRIMAIIILSLNIVVPIAYIFYGFLGEYVLRNVFIYSGLAMVIYCLIIQIKVRTTKL